MAYQDRDYYRDPGANRNPLMWLVAGRVPLFTAFGIRVQAHASMIVYAALVLLLGLGTGFAWQDRVQSVTMLFAIVLLHEFGHCFAARWVGGDADEIIMHPLGGLALTRPPRRPLPTFITVAAGPAVNLIICIITGVIMWAMRGWVPWNPVRFQPMGNFQGWLSAWRYVGWIYQISLSLLFFNLLPIFPLDGGQMLQAILWPKFGYYKSMMFSCVAGMVAATLGAMVALATLNVFLALLAVMGFLYCRNLRRALLANGPEEYADDGIDYSAAYDNTIGRPKPKSARSIARDEKRAARLANDEASEQKQIDAILGKVAASGMQSLNWMEKRALARATERQKERDRERSTLRRAR